ncbi:MAG: CvpA family protein [Patescibacteria group bacterium]
MGWFDLAVLVFLGYFVFIGYRRGLVSQVFGLAGTVIALVAAFSYFGAAGEALARLLPVGREICGLLGFVLIVVVINGLFAFVGHRWRNMTKTSTLSLIDATAGAFFGGLKALVILVIAIVLLVSLPIPALRQWVEEGPLTSRILQAAPIFYLLQERSLPPNVPRLLITSQGVQLKKVNFADLDGSACLACRGKAGYMGFRRKGLLSYPFFTCKKCGLVSDGCLTYEGYHLIYGQCPLKRANRGESFNCRVWPNAGQVQPRGPCPVCGAR